MRRPDVFTLDYSHPLAQGLVFAGLERYFFDSSLYRISTSQGVLPVFDGEIGRTAFDFVGTSGKSLFINNGDIFKTSAFTLSFFTTPKSGSNRWILGQGQSANIEFAIGRSDLNKDFRVYSGGTARWTSANNVTLIGQQNHWSVVAGGGFSPFVNSVHRDGIQLTPTSNTSASPTWAASSVWVGGQITGGFWDRWIGSVADVVIHNRALSPAEIALLADRTDPMLGGLIVEERPVLYFDMGGSTTDELTALDLIVGSPVLGAPALGQVHALTAQDLVVGSPVLGSPVLGQVHALTANDLVVGSPVLGTPALTENASNVDALTAQGLVVGSPVLGSPAFGQVHALAPLDLVVGSPVLGTPALSDGTVQPAPTQTGGGIGRKIFLRTDRRQEEDDLILAVINKFLEVVQ